MWRDWRPDVVRDDFRRLADLGLTQLRVFPLWPDFQPLVRLTGVAGATVEFRVGPAETPLSRSQSDAIDPVMVDRFVALCEAADCHGLRLVVGLVTGWMSGRLFVPPALDGLNVLTDPVALTWQVRFVRGLVSRLATQSAIVAWDLGNECNCMGQVRSAEEAYLWTATIAQSIRAADPQRPIVSGMHSLSVQPGAPWRIVDQAELTDVLTTHPYPYWVSHGRIDPLDTYRTALLPTIETCLYRDIAGKPAIVEEIGSMGPMVASDALAAGWMRINLLALWAHDARCVLWWCGFDQTDLGHAPYDWVGVEPELGLFRHDGSPKPVASEIRHMARWLASLPIPKLPERRTNALCILSRDQDSWAAAIGAFALAKQARMEVVFRFADQAWPEAACYLLPCLSGVSPVRRHEWLALLERVRAGATLYLSLNDGILPGFVQATGLEVVRRGKRHRADTLTWLEGECPEMAVREGDELDLALKGASAIAQGRNGPLFTRFQYGSGVVFCLAFPLEMQVALTPGELEPPASRAAARVYQTVVQTLAVEHAFHCAESRLCITEHPVDDATAVIVVLNPTSTPVDAVWAWCGSWAADTILRGELPEPGRSLQVPAKDGLVILARRQRSAEAPME